MRLTAIASRTAAALVLPALLAGCKTWQSTAVSPERLIAAERPSSIRVTTSDGSTRTLRSPRVINDSIVSGSSGTGGPVTTSRIGVPRHEVRSVEVARFSPRRTIVLAAAIAAVSIGWASMVDTGGGSTVITEPLPKEPALSIGGWLGLLLGR